MLDTNVAIHLRDGDLETIDKVAALDGAVLLSIVTRVELEGGLYTDPAKAAARRLRLQAILDAIPVLPFDEVAAQAYGTILEATGYSRRNILDRMIAAQALAHHARIVTMNPDDFKDVPGLQLVCW